MSDQPPHVDPRPGEGHLPVRTEMLDYARANASELPKFNGRMFALGLVFPLVYSVVAVMLTVVLAPSSSLAAMMGWLFAALFVAVLVGVQLRTKTWVFVTGALTGVLLLPVIGFVMLAIMCSM